MSPAARARVVKPAPSTMEWLRRHLVFRELLTFPASHPAWSRVKQELRRCAELRRMLLMQGMWN